MRIHIDEHGNGASTAVLLHGMLGSGGSWWRVIPLLVDRGYRVLAVDLPGHGLSDRDRELTVERAAAHVVAAVAGAAPAGIDLAIGHSFGGQILAAAAPDMRPRLAVYVDSPFVRAGGRDHDVALHDYEQQQARRTADWLRTNRPFYRDEEVAIEALAAIRFDPATAAANAASPGGRWWPAAGSIVVRPDPSDYIDNDTAERLLADGVTVRTIPSASHAIWYSHPDAFIAALPEVFGHRR